MLRKIHATINIGGHTIKYAFYVMKDDTSIEHNGILVLRPVDSTILFFHEDSFIITVRNKL